MSSRAWLNVPIGLLVSAGVLLIGGPAAAQVQSETLSVTARIGEVCTVTSASVDFGQALNLNANNDATGAIDISCATNTNLSVALDGGQTPGFSGERKLVGSGGQIQYFLYKDSGRTQQWTAGDAVATTIAGGSGSVPVYGRVPSQTDGHSSGEYTDEVTITLVF